MCIMLRLDVSNLVWSSSKVGVFDAVVWILDTDCGRAPFVCFEKRSKDNILINKIDTFFAQFEFDLSVWHKEMQSKNYTNIAH